MLMRATQYTEPYLYDEIPDALPCESCDGTGTEEHRNDRLRDSAGCPDDLYDEAPCSTCDGTGAAYCMTCPPDTEPGVAVAREGYDGEDMCAECHAEGAWWEALEEIVTLGSRLVHASPLRGATTNRTGGDAHTQRIELAKFSRRVIEAAERVRTTKQALFALMQDHSEIHETAPEVA